MRDTVGEVHKKTCVFDLILDEVGRCCICMHIVMGFLQVKVFHRRYGHYWQVCIWDHYSRTMHTLMDNLEKTLDDANIQMDQDVRTGLIIVSNGKLCFNFLTCICPFRS